MRGIILLVDSWLWRRRGRGEAPASYRVVNTSPDGRFVQVVVTKGSGEQIRYRVARDPLPAATPRSPAEA